MHLIEIDVVGAQAAQARLAGLADPFWGKILGPLPLRRHPVATLQQARPAHLRLLPEFRLALKDVP